MCSTVLAGAVCEANIDLYCGTVTFVVDIDWSGTAVALVWYCPVCSQYRLVCPENVADLLHLGFIFNFHQIGWRMEVIGGRTRIHGRKNGGG